MPDLDPIAEADTARPGCEPGQAALQRLLDGDPSWDAPEAAAHRSQCVHCREELALGRSMTRLTTNTVVPAGLAEQIVHQTVSARRRERLYRIAVIGVALAASVVVAAIAVWPAKEPQAQPARSVAVTATPAPPEATPDKPLGEAVSEARDALVTLTKRTANEPRERIGNLLPAPKLPGAPDTGDDLQPLADARSGAARSVEPITSSARRAMNLFLRAADPPDRTSQP